ncbi:type II toxin-antitoxin system VapC family toxin [Candidatus Woesearchaeota archaeon]|nr:type II toxin-antitoxin system VapC family toxin [Candidatus Woesearchaeota archaeon]
MRFLDSNVIVYTFFNQKRKNEENSNALKQKSRAIFNKIDEGEAVTTSVVNLSEAANILKTCYPSEELTEILELFYGRENITILDVTQQDYFTAIHLSKKVGGKINDCLIAYLMKKHNIKEIYTFDIDFKNFPWITIVN